MHACTEACTGNAFFFSKGVSFFVVCKCTGYCTGGCTDIIIGAFICMPVQMRVQVAVQINVPIERMRPAFIIIRMLVQVCVQGAV